MKKTSFSSLDRKMTRSRSNNIMSKLVHEILKLYCCLLRRDIKENLNTLSLKCNGYKKTYIRTEDCLYHLPSKLFE